MTIYKIEIGDSTCFGEESLAFVSYLDGLGHDVTMTNSGGNYIDGFRVEDGDCPVDLNHLWIGYCNS